MHIGRLKETDIGKLTIGLTGGDTVIVSRRPREIAWRKYRPALYGIISRALMRISAMRGARRRGAYASALLRAAQPRIMLRAKEAPIASREMVRGSACWRGLWPVVSGIEISKVRERRGRGGGHYRRRLMPSVMAI